jgi:hypothetical protein
VLKYSSVFNILLPSLQFRIATVEDRKERAIEGAGGKRSRFLWKQRDLLGIKGDLRKKINKSKARKTGIFSLSEAGKEFDELVGELEAGGGNVEAAAAGGEGRARAPAPNADDMYGDL